MRSMLSLFILFICSFSCAASYPYQQQRQQELLDIVLRANPQLTPQQRATLTAAIAQNPKTTQGTSTSTHPMTREQCRANWQAAGGLPNVAENTRLCGAPNMVPIYDRNSGRTKEQAPTCIDQFEFPNVLCEYPATWVTNKQARDICGAMGKRLCDAHEWEGACAGNLNSPETEYNFRVDRKTSQIEHNQKRDIVWSYGKIRDAMTCGTFTQKAPTCYPEQVYEGKYAALKRTDPNAREPNVYEACGASTWPAGGLAKCSGNLSDRPGFEVFDMHGNAAEHMNLPLSPTQFTRNGGVGVAEMKGSWYLFAENRKYVQTRNGAGVPEQDDCRWRAPGWHANEGLTHQMHHLSFRCCKDR